MERYATNRKMRVVGLGEVLWDMLPGGKQMAAPRPILRITPRHSAPKPGWSPAWGMIRSGGKILEYLANMQISVAECGD